ncbi:purine nucleoside phosphorylase [Plesiocystis pacifica SIR-1]|uniref:Purine nucleoside phosphorylase n=1 Tax=Plesiocystis pacifica SIR-1 TaxID=391625 RepID=A6GFX2_9BACT|nr:hypothetical protein [Plesiocystis pacifica]EDM75217.1 purine nucleoside phosphorylase [Plesiocystis pacifica SIR-1]
MIKRLLSPTLLTIAALSLTACPGNTDDIGSGNRPYVDDWEEIAAGPASAVGFLSIGTALTSDNFASRGDVDIEYVEGTDQITIEMQRFGVFKSQDQADEGFEKMWAWAYDQSSPSVPTADMDEVLCWMPETSACYATIYYDGQIQPSRVGANFRVRIPVGWDGDIQVETEDNLADGPDTYPDRSDVRIIGANGNVEVLLDSGNVDIKLDPNLPHYAGCTNSQACEDNFGVEPDPEDPFECSCDTPTNITVENRTGQSSNITIDVSDAASWYTAQLENRGDFSASDDFVCNAAIDCASFADCGIDPDYADIPNEERAEINFPGVNTIEGTGIRLVATSEQCSVVPYVDGPDDFGADTMPEEKRGELNVCVGCL